MSPRKKKKAKPKPIDLKLTLENFGPLRKAEIDLKPLTIFIGPNNSGKSYAAMMFYSLFRSYWHGDTGPPIFPLKTADEGTTKQLNPWRFFHRPFCPEALTSFLKQNQPLDEGKRIDVPPELLRKVTREIFREVSLGVLEGQICSCYDASLKELQREAGGPFQLTITAGDWIARLKDEEDQLAIVSIDPGSSLKETQIRFKIDLITRDQAEEATLQQRTELAVLGHTLASDALRPFWLRLDRGHFYLPAQRSSLLQILTQLIEKRLTSMTDVLADQVKEPSLTGASRWFLMNLVKLGDQPLGPFAELAGAIESDLLQGEIHLRTAGEGLPPAFCYRFDGREIPLHRASSSISELAPIILYIRFLAHPGCVLIIDEPEAHLHPRNQRILAKYLVKLVREGVNLIITTHSDYLFGQINNYILRGKLREKQLKEKSDDLPDVYLKHDEVGAYLFKKDNRIKKGVAYRTEELEVTDEGFSEQEFVKVSHAMYDELVDLRRQIDPKEYLDDEW